MSFLGSSSGGASRIGAMLVRHRVIAGTAFAATAVLVAGCTYAATASTSRYRMTIRFVRTLSY